MKWKHKYSKKVFQGEKQFETTFNKILFTVITVKRANCIRFNLCNCLERKQKALRYSNVCALNKRYKTSKTVK